MRRIVSLGTEGPDVIVSGYGARAVLEDGERTETHSVSFELE